MLSLALCIALSDLLITTIIIIITIIITTEHSERRMMKLSRRRLLLSAGTAAIGGIGAGLLPDIVHASDRPPRRNPGAGGAFVPVRTPNGWSLPWRMRDGVKEFHLVAEEFEHEFAEGGKATVWGYNGSTPGPTIEARRDEPLRVLATTNRPDEPLPEGASNARVVPWVSYSQVMPEADLVICHGGHGTVCRALGAGVPEASHASSQNMPTSAAIIPSPNRMRWLTIVTECCGPDQHSQALKLRRKAQRPRQPVVCVS